MAIIGTATVEIHATLDAVRDEIKKGLDEALAGINGKIKLTVDNAEANVKLDETKAKTDGLDGSEPTITPKVDNTEADAKLFALKTKVDEFGNKTVSIKFKADTGEADAKIAASKAAAGKGLNLKADASDALKEFDKVGFALSGLGLSVNVWGSAAFDKFALIGGAAAGAGGAIGSAFAALPALLGGLAASAIAVKVGFSGVGTVIQGMAPDATKAQVQAMVKELSGMGAASQATALQLGTLVNGPMADMKKNIQSNLLGSLNGDFTQLGTTTVPILDTAMQGVAKSMGTGLHTAIQNLIAQGPQLTSMMGGVQTFAKTLGEQTLPTVTGMFVNMGAAAGPAMGQVSSGFQSIFAGMNSVVSNAIFTGQFTQSVAALGPVFQGLGNLINPLLGGIIQLGAALGGPLGQALTAIGKLIGPLIPILSSLGTNVLNVVTVLANALTPILQSLTPLIEEFFNSLGSSAMDDFKALAPLIQILATAFLQILNAIEPLLGPFSTTMDLFNALGQIVQQLVPFIKVFVAVVVQIVDALNGALAPVIPVIVKAFGDFLKAITPILPIIGDLIVQLINGLAPILPTLVQLLDNVIKAMLPWIPTIMQILPPMLQLVLMVLPPLNGLLKFLADNSWIVVAALSAWAAIKMVGVVGGWAESIAGVAGKVNNFATELSYLPNRSKEAEEGAKGLLSQIKEMPGNFKGAVSGVTEFAKGIGSNLLGGIKSFGAALLPVIGSVWSFTAALLANPITWIVLGIVALIAAIVLLITHFSEVKKVFLEVWGAISSFFSGVWKDIKNIAESVWSAISGFFTGAWNAISNLWKTVWGAVSGFFVSIWNDIKNVATTVWNAITGVFRTVWDAVAGYFEKLWNVRFKQPVMDIWNAISNFLTTAFNDFKSFFEGIWNGISDFFSAIWNGIKAAATFIWDAIVAYFTLAFNVYKTIFETVWNVISTIFTTVWNAIKSVAETVWGWISSFFTAEFNGFKAIFEFVWNAISSVFSTVWNAIKAVASTVWGWISSFFTAEFNGFKAIFETIWNAISSVFSTVWNAIKGVATSVWDGIKSFFVGAFNDFKGIFEGIWNGIKKTFDDVWNGIKKTASDVWDGIKSVFTGSINGVIGFINGLLHGINKVLDFFFIPKIPDIPTLAAGGVLTLTPQLAAGGALGIPALAAGGGLGDMWETVGSGFKTSGPRAIVGEGNPMYPEYVIPTDPAHRQRATMLLGNAAKDMGLGGGKASIPGVKHPTGQGGAPMLGLGDLLGSAWNATGGKVVHAVASGWDDVTSWIGSRVADGVHGLVDAAKHLMPNNLVGHMVDGALDKLANGLISWITKKNADTPKGTSGNVQSWAPTVKQVLAQLGVPQSALNGVLNIIQHESGGNPLAINNWDSNAKAGHPSQGLMQTIPSTFAAYAGPYVSRGITDGMANIYAGVNYALHNYGVSWLTNGGNKSSGGAYMGYDSGGWLAPGVTQAINLTGRNEAVLPIDMMKNAIVAAVHSAFAFPAAARNVTPGQFANQTSNSTGDVHFEEGAFQVIINGNADHVTVQQLQQTLSDWNNELVYQLRGRR